MRQAWEAAAAGIDAPLYAETRPELRRALEKFAKPLKEGRA